MKVKTPQNQTADDITDHIVSFDLGNEQKRIMSGEVSFTSAAAMVVALKQASADSDAASRSPIDEAYLQAEILTDALALSPANSLEDIAQKVEAWMAMAPEAVKDVGRASCDEYLAYSIMQDIQRLRVRSKGLR